MQGLNVLVVDDEKRHRRGLAALIRRLRPDFEVYEAKNGREAYELMRTDPVDLLITDIRMPVMNGMELVEMLQTMSNHGKMVLLTAYAQFEYAQKAIGLGVYDYLVKPVDVDQIASLLDKVESSILGERKQKAEREQLVKQLNRTYPYFSEHQLHDWIHGLLDADEVECLNERFEPDSDAIVLVFQMQGGEPEVGPPPGEWKAALNDRLTGIGCCVTFELDARPRETVAVVNLREGARIESIEHTVHELLSVMHDSYPIRFAVGVGNAYRWQGRDIAQSLIEAQTAVEFSFYYGPGEVISFAALPLKADHRPYAGRSEALSAAVRLAGFANAEAILGEVLQDATDGGYPHPAELKEAVLQLLANAAAIFSPLIPARDYERFIDEIKCRIGRCQTYPALRQAAADTICTMSDKMAELHLHKHDSIMTDCLNYIDRHFNEEELSLVELAHRFHFNISYFSNFIKKKTGSSFSRHLLNVRMSHAKELLRSTDLKIYEIAEKVGYRDVKYFNRVFKKELGVSPYTFRQLAFQSGEGMPV